MTKLALFDFCETLVGFQTADAFVDYVRKENGTLYMRTLNLILRIMSKTKVIALFNKFFPGRGISKRLKLLQIRGKSVDSLNTYAKSFYDKEIRPALITPVLDEMKRFSNLKYEIVIVSAGYSIYLKYFAEEFKIKHLIATELAFSKERSKGIVLGRDCIKNEKIVRINAYFEGHSLDLENSVSYSDSISDLPMLLLTGKGVVVSRKQSQEWANQYQLKEIIWN